MAEPVIQQSGANRIVVQLPGVQDTAKAKDILGRTATLEVRMVEDDPSKLAEALSGIVPAGYELLDELSAQGSQKFWSNEKSNSLATISMMHNPGLMKMARLPFISTSIPPVQAFSAKSQRITLANAWQWC